MRRLHRFFGRRAGKPQVPGRLAGDSPEDWKAGDLAECIRDGFWYAAGLFPHNSGPRRGEVRAVQAVRIACHGDNCREYLVFARYGDAGYISAAFRKITPRADEATRGDAASLDDLLTIGQPAPARPEPVEPERVP